MQEAPLMTSSINYEMEKYGIGIGCGLRFIFIKNIMVIYLHLLK